jgi:uncharacterized protein (DUF488 family)
MSGVGTPVLGATDPLQSATIYTIGHGSRTTDEFAGILRQTQIERLIDVRAFPVVRRHPQFARDALQAALCARGIGYEWQGQALGGFREPAPHSPHVALKHDAFRGFADHMQSAQFRAVLASALLGGVSILT